jgi:hypothetical protein
MQEYHQSLGAYQSNLFRMWIQMGQIRFKSAVSAVFDILPSVNARGFQELLLGLPLSTTRLT